MPFLRESSGSRKRGAEAAPYAHPYTHPRYGPTEDVRPRESRLSSKKPLIDKRNRGPFLVALVVFTLTGIGTALVVLFLVGAFD
jgi:hypothetical protein